MGAVLKSDGSLSEYQVAATKVKVSHKLTYEKADALLAQGTGCEHTELRVLREAATVRCGTSEHMSR